MAEQQNLFFVRTNDRKLARHLVEYIIDKGHQKIAFFTYRVVLEKQGVIQEHLTGYIEGLENNHLKYKCLVGLAAPCNH